MKLKQIFIPVILLALILTGCNRYNKLTFSSKQAFKKKEVTQNIEEYDVYVHDKDETYRLNDPQIREEKLSGTPTKIEESAIEETSTSDEKNDIHLYLDDEGTVDYQENSTQEFTSEDIESVEMYAKDSDGDTRIIVIVLVVIGIILLLGLILLLIIVNTAANASGSGGSDSGGSDSGCYVATLAYDDYNAPQVMVLRRFRDRFLQKSKAGRAFIGWYYAHSPAFVERYRSYQTFHRIMRGGLNVLVAMLRPFYGK